MTDTLTALFGPANVASGTNDVVTVTSSHTYTVKRLKIINNTGAAITIKLGVGGVADANLVLPPISIPAGGWWEEDVPFILTSTQVLKSNASATGLTISGFGVDTV